MVDAIFGMGDVESVGDPNPMTNAIDALTPYFPHTRPKYIQQAIEAMTTQAPTEVMIKKLFSIANQALTDFKTAVQNGDQKLFNQAEEAICTLVGQPKYSECLLTRAMNNWSALSIGFIDSTGVKLAEALATFTGVTVTENNGYLLVTLPNTIPPGAYAAYSLADIQDHEACFKSIASLQSEVSAAEKFYLKQV